MDTDTHAQREKPEIWSGFHTPSLLGPGSSPRSPRETSPDLPPLFWTFGFWLPNARQLDSLTPHRIPMPVMDRDSTRLGLGPRLSSRGRSIWYVPPGHVPARQPIAAPATSGSFTDATRSKPKGRVQYPYLTWLFLASPSHHFSNHLVRFCFLAYY